MAPQHMPQSIGNMASIVGEKNKIEREHSFKKYSQTGISKEAERTKHNKEHDYRKYMPISNSERENEKSRYETDHGYKMPVSSKSSISNSSVRENEKINHDKGHEHKKTISKPNVLPSWVIRENEKSKAVKDSRDLSIEASKFKKESNLKAASDSSVIVINTHQEEPQHTVNLSDDKKELSAVIPLPKAAHCQVIDLTDSAEANKIPKSEEERPFNLSKELVGFASSHEIYPDPKKLSR
ncbi:hypothetical protein NQ317_002309 [Molorchus minor]|uniref:Uncharacterized protein n=1 Tax=Molorchus minor TaxID=1323400 RepID=A0ABQ9J1U5_9CUCU|nr:hypothetical protein NQ317_002309 [Molorchus minor]